MGKKRCARGAATRPEGACVKVRWVGCVDGRRAGDGRPFSSPATSGRRHERRTACCMSWPWGGRAVIGLSRELLTNTATGTLQLDYSVQAKLLLPVLSGWRAAGGRHLAPYAP